MNQEKIGKFIAKLRKEKGLTQEDLAEKLKVSINAVSKWERGICLMDMSLLIPLSEILNVSILDILNGEIVEEKNEPLIATKLLEQTVDYSSKEMQKIKRKIPFFIIVIIILAIISSGTLIYFNLIRQSEIVEINSNEKLLNLDIENDIASSIKTGSNVDIYVLDNNAKKDLLLSNCKVYKINEETNNIIIVIPKEYHLNLTKLAVTGNVKFWVEKSNSHNDKNNILLSKYVNEIKSENN